MKSKSKLIPIFLLIVGNLNKSHFRNNTLDVEAFQSKSHLSGKLLKQPSLTVFVLFCYFDLIFKFWLSLFSILSLSLWASFCYSPIVYRWYWSFSIWTFQPSFNQKTSNSTIFLNGDPSKTNEIIESKNFF